MIPQLPIRVFSSTDFQEVKTADAYIALLQHFTYIQAAGGIVNDEAGNILMIYRRGCWDLPKGKVETGESVESAALREVEEETGIKAEIIGKKPFSVWHTYDTYGTPMLKETVWFVMKALPGQQTVPQTEEDIAQVQWVPRNQVSELLRESFPSLQYLWGNFQSI